MTRKEGYIDVDKMLKEIGINDVNMSKLIHEFRINILTNVGSKKLLSFNYNGKTYFYKYGKYNDPYNELVAEELAKDFGIRCITYDLAILNGIKGVISENYKEQNANYILGERLLGNYYNDADGDLEKYNNLKAIQFALEYRYQNHPNKNQIISNLMRQVVDIFLFDIIVCQYDRNSKNWELVENGECISIGPLFDNEGILNSNHETLFVALTLEEKSYDILWNVLEQFKMDISEEFINIIKEKLWIISEENLYKVFGRIENKTGYPMPEERKNFYVSNYRKHKKRLEEVLGLAVEREELNERKNR